MQKKLNGDWLMKVLYCDPDSYSKGRLTSDEWSEARRLAHTPCPAGTAAKGGGGGGRPPPPPVRYGSLAPPIYTSCKPPTRVYQIIR
jgi:hypothetical protein